jgi:hypothetical protein
MKFDPIIIETFIREQLHTWQTARDSYAALADARIRTVPVNDIPYKVQFNPARIGSTAAPTDPQSISERPCFLCRANRPAAQRSIGNVLGRYEILLNPHPIFPRHLTIPLADHQPQLLTGERFADLLELAQILPDFTLLYNGARSGASAPDHFHFQAGSRGILPIEQEALRNRFERYAIFIDTADSEEAAARFAHLYHRMEEVQKSLDPMLNLLCRYQDGRWTVCIFPRKKFRPDCYYASGDARLLCSPAAAEMGGLIVLPREEDFEKITAADIQHIIQEVS